MRRTCRWTRGENAAVAPIEKNTHMQQPETPFDFSPAFEFLFILLYIERTFDETRLLIDNRQQHAPRVRNQTFALTLKVVETKFINEETSSH